MSLRTLGMLTEGTLSFGKMTSSECDECGRERERGGCGCVISKSVDEEKGEEGRVS